MKARHASAPDAAPPAKDPDSAVPGEPSAPGDAATGGTPGLGIGTRLRTIRTARGLSQRELARRSGVANGLISLIEQDRTSPSVSSLKRILDGIPMTLAEFFALETPPGKRIFFTADELTRLVSGTLTVRQVGDSRGRSLQILHERYEPGADTGETMLRHEAEEGGLVLRGQIEITVGDQCQVLRAGDAYYFDSRLPHRFRNLGADSCEIVSACTPPSF